MPDFIAICGLPKSGTFTLATFLQLSHLTSVYSNNWWSYWEPVHWTKGDSVSVMWNRDMDDVGTFTKIEEMLANTAVGPILVNRSDGFEYNWRNFNLNCSNPDSWRFIYCKRRNPDSNFDSMVKAGGYPETAHHVYVKEQEYSEASFQEIKAGKRYFCVDTPDYLELCNWLGLQMNSNMKWFSDLNPVTHRGFGGSSV